VLKLVKISNFDISSRWLTYRLLISTSIIYMKKKAHTKLGD